jgi:two-component system LytT family sensor kinase
MKKLIVFVALLFTIINALAQKTGTDQKSFGHNIDFRSDVLSDGYASDIKIVVPDTAIYTIFSAIKKSLSKSHAKINLSSDPLLGVKLDPGLIDYNIDNQGFFGETFRSYTITNNSEAILVAMGINKDNVNNYRYRVVLNDSVEVTHWSVPKLAQDYGAKAPFGMIGRFKAPGKNLLIEVVNIKDYSKARVMLNWRTDFKPVIGDIQVYKDGDYFDLKNMAENRHMATRFDKRSGIPLDLKFRKGDVASIAWSFASISVPYNIYLVEKKPGQKPQRKFLETQTPPSGAYNFGNINYSKPGKYELIIEPKTIHQADQTLYIPFEVLPPLPLLQQFSLKQIAPYVIGGIVFLLLCFALYYFYNKRKLRSAERARAMAVVQLKSVRSQLNPHFMFNALTSIQNLMNQHDTIGANNYLNKFADLTRQVLNSSGQELISLEDELSIVTNYLQMEQLRFGFQYTIKAEPGINKANTEIPAMLLQPFIENAAKHGVNALQGNGKIEVTITKQDQDLILTVADNGPGFNDKGIDPKGFGLKLSRERIALLNDIYKSQPIYLQVDSNTNGVKITITLTNWV